MDGPPRPLVLYIWPSAWSLPSLDPHCIIALLFLQLHFPDQYVVVECADPDLSPSGRLPFLIHNLHTVSPLLEILNHLSGLDSDALHNLRRGWSDELGQRDLQDTIAWKSYVDSNLGNLISSTLYGNRENYYQLTRPALAKSMSFPMRFYVPDRVRSEHLARLERLGWANVQDETDKAVKRKPDLKEQTEAEFRSAFRAAKDVERARPVLDDLAQLLGTNDFFFQNRPTLLDLYLASHVALLISPPFLHAHISDLIRNDYPQLHALTQRVLAILPPFGTWTRLPSPRTSPLAPLSRTLKAVPIVLPRLISRVEGKKDKEVQKAESMADAGLWSVGNLLWGASALGAMVGFAFATGWINVRIPSTSIPDDYDQRRGTVGDGDAVMDEIVLGFKA